MDSVLIRNGRVVTAVDDYRADVLVENGRIVTIGESLSVGEHVEEVDASRLLVLPGGIDCHTHMENTFGASTTCDTYESGTKAAVGFLCNGHSCLPGVFPEAPGDSLDGDLFVVGLLGKLAANGGQFFPRLLAGDPPS